MNTSSKTFLKLGLGFMIIPVSASRLIHNWLKFIQRSICSRIISWSGLQVCRRLTGTICSSGNQSVGSLTFTSVTVDVSGTFPTKTQRWWWYFIRWDIVSVPGSEEDQVTWSSSDHQSGPADSPGTPARTREETDTDTDLIWNFLFITQHRWRTDVYHWHKHVFFLESGWFLIV